MLSTLLRQRSAGGLCGTRTHWRDGGSCGGDYSTGDLGAGEMSHSGMTGDSLAVAERHIHSHPRNSVKSINTG
jgi:hypothetical protein